MSKNKQRKKALRVAMAYSNAQTALALKQSNPPTSQQVQQSNNIYYSITELPFDRFLSVLINKDYKCLIKSYKGEYSENAYLHHKVYVLQVVKAWEGIYLEYCDHMSGTDNHNIETIADIARLDNRLTKIQVIIDRLKEYYTPEAAELLHDLGISTVVTKESLHEDLLRVVTESKGYVMQLDKLNSELMKHQSNTEPTYDVFERLLAEIDAKLQAKDITTLRFCILYNKLKKKLNGARRED